jgi:uncharacterized protein
MRVVITGGTGFIGRALWDPLTSRGDEVVLLTRSPERERDLPPGVREAGWDAQSGDGWYREITADTVIVNLASEILLQWRWTDSRKKEILQSRVRAGEAVVDAIRRAGTQPAALIQASGVGYYGTRGAEPFTEDSPPGNDFLGRVCVAWEASTSEVETLGVRRVSIRSGVVLDKGSPALRLMALPFKFFVGGPVGSGQQILNWIHRTDEVRAILHLIDMETASGPYNLTAPLATSYAEFARALGRVMNRPSMIRVPAFPLRLALGEMGRSIVLEGQFARPVRLQESGFTYQYPEIEPALRAALNANRQPHAG